MRGKTMFLVGAAAGWVLGTRAGREKYDQMMQAAHKAMENPTVHETTGQIQAQATKLLGQGKETLANSKIADKVRRRDSDTTLDEEITDQKMSANSF
jgi:negative regulator of sigma E activity